jgi:hypothetical protein
LFAHYLVPPYNIYIAGFEQKSSLLLYFLVR